MGEGKERRKLEKDLPGAVGSKAGRRLKARRTREKGVWFGMGMFGLVGWSVAMYTILGIILGSWIDRTWPGGYSWTLTLLILGLAAGCLTAWYWIKKETGSEDERE